MVNLVASIKNNDTKEFGALMMFPSEKIARAQFLTWSDKQAREDKYFDPADYELHIFAKFNSQDCKIVGLVKPIVILPEIDDEKE